MKDEVVVVDGLMDLRVVIVLHGLDVAYADNTRGERFFMNLNSQGICLEQLQHGMLIKARADKPSGWLNWVQLM